MLVAIKNNLKNTGLSDPGQVINKDKDYSRMLQGPVAARPEKENQKAVPGIINIALKSLESFLT
jgi:hypothetical protein